MIMRRCRVRMAVYCVAVGDVSAVVVTACRTHGLQVRVRRRAAVKHLVFQLYPCRSRIFRVRVEIRVLNRQNRANGIYEVHNGRQRVQARVVALAHSSDTRAEVFIESRILIERGFRADFVWSVCGFRGLFRPRGYIGRRARVA